jgi:hypothetical protein
MNTRNILSPNSEYERQEELRSLFSRELSLEDIACLNSSPTEDHNSISLIGCLLKDDHSLINLARLLIAKSIPYQKDLYTIATKELSKYDDEKLLEAISKEFIENTDNLSKVENKIFGIIFSISQ